MPLAGLEPAIPASKRPQSHALDSALTGIGAFDNSDFMNILVVTDLNNAGDFECITGWSTLRAKTKHF